MHGHLDPLGGVAGDMFVAAALDAWPHLVEPVREAVAALGLSAEVVAHHDGVMGGLRFSVAAPPSPDHRSHADVIELISVAPLNGAVIDRALGIFADLADAEAAVHDVDVATVSFHEVGAWDSLADVVAAAAAIEFCGVTTWSTGPLPLGSGTVTTRHGVLPVPAPATQRLLAGLPVVDDGVPGERVTPTGAAIVRHLAPVATRPSTPTTISATGHGFGTRVLPDRPNALRLTVLEAVTQARTSAEDAVGVIEFDVDDQSLEDLAVGLDRLRGRSDVIDVVQRTATGKKSRLVVEVRVLCHPEAIDEVASECFNETRTLGVRHRVASRFVLERTEMAVDGRRVKTVTRPDGRRTSKVDIDDVATSGGWIDRESERFTTGLRAGHGGDQ